MSEPTKESLERADRVAECIIAICGSFVPGGWAHPGERCVGLIRDQVFAVALAAQEEALEAVKAALQCGKPHYEAPWPAEYVEIRFSRADWEAVRRAMKGEGR